MVVVGVAVALFLIWMVLLVFGSRFFSYMFFVIAYKWWKSERVCASTRKLKSHCRKKTTPFIYFCLLLYSSEWIWHKLLKVDEIPETSINCTIFLFISHLMHTTHSHTLHIWLNFSIFTAKNPTRWNRKRCAFHFHKCSERFFVGKNSAISK